MMLSTTSRQKQIPSSLIAITVRAESLEYPMLGTEINLQIACSVNAGYSLPLLVMLQSLVNTLRPPHRAVVRLIQREPCHQTLDAIGSFMEVHSVALTASNMSQLPRDSHFPPEAAVPLLLHSLLPEDMERVIFLDADMLIVKDISPIWLQSLAGRPFGAVQDSAIPTCGSPRGLDAARELGIPSDAPYFNAGVLLLDLACWREERIAESALAYLRKPNVKHDFMHQGALNAVASDSWLPLDPMWNVPLTAGRWFDRTPESASVSPGIIHYAGQIKPWRTRTSGRFANEYLEILRSVQSSHLIPNERSTTKERLLGFYDRNLRSVFFPIEKSLWNRGLI
jgi:lipopolysaccharide biosynthesis glycosyltransferase